MTRRRPSARSAAVAVGLALIATGCQTPADTIQATGRVRPDAVVVQAPVLNVPRVNLDAGLPVAPGQPGARSAVPAMLSLGSAQEVAAVAVRLGDQVRAGDVLVRFAHADLAAQQRVAKADAALADAQLAVLDAALETVADKERDLRDARRKVQDGIAQATGARAELARKLSQVRTTARKLAGQRAVVEKQLAELQDKRTAVEAQLAEVGHALDALPPDAPPEARAPLLAAQQQLTTAKAQLDAGIGQLAAARTKLAAASGQLGKGIGQLIKAQAKVAAGLAKARAGLRRIEAGLDRLADARAQLLRNRKLAVIAAADDSGVDAADLARSQAVVRAPSAGVVTSIASLGQVLAPGATVARIGRPATRLTAWLAPDAAAGVCLGDVAEVRIDSLAGVASGQVSRILPETAYPPSYQTTDRIHLTRAVPVEVTVDTALPAGSPADLRITPCRTTRGSK